MITSVHLSYLLGDLPFEKRFDAARRLGFQAVEYPFPFDVPPSDYARLLRDNGLEQITVGTPTSNYKAGEPGYAVTLGLKRKFDESVSSAIEYAKQIGCRRVHVFAGVLPPGEPLELAWSTYCANLAAAHDKLADAGLETVIEPVNSMDFPSYFLNSLASAKRAIQQSGRNGIGVVLDVYHANVNSEDPLQFLREERGRTSHIQLADFPGRHEPGTGTIDFQELFNVLEEVDYTGSIGLEYVPTHSLFDTVPLSGLLRLSSGFRNYS